MIDRLKLKIYSILCLILLMSSSAYAQSRLDNVPSGTAVIMSFNMATGSSNNGENTEWGTRHYKISMHARHGTVTILDELAGIVQYKSDPGFVGSDSFSISYYDENDFYVYGGMNFDFEVTGSTIYQVTKTSDTHDGICDIDCSFRDAVTAANANLGKDVIYLPGGDYNLSQPSVITDDVIISGEYDPSYSTPKSQIFGGGFRIEGVRLDLYHLSYYSGKLISGSSPYITLYDVGVYNSSGFDSLFPGEEGIGSMLAFESEFIDYNCGAVLVGDEITASRIVVARGGNKGLDCSSSFTAIAMQSYTKAGVVKVFSSSIHNNEMDYGFVSIWPATKRAYFSLVNTSIHHNTGQLYNGMVQMWGNIDAIISNSSFVGNAHASSIYAGFDSWVSLVNNLFAYNGEQECVTFFGSPITSYGNNVYTSNSSSNCGPHATDIFNSLFDYAIQPSYAYTPNYLYNFELVMPYDNQVDVIDSANDDYCPHIDIDGFQRPADGDLNGTFQCDIGAAEWNAEWLEIDILANGSEGFVELNSSDSLTVTLSLMTFQTSLRQVEWWISASTPMGWYYFDGAVNSWLPGDELSHQGALFTVTDFPVLSTSGLPSGDYRFHFDIDTTLDGLKDNASTSSFLEVSILP